MGLTAKDIEDIPDLIKEWKTLDDAKFDRLWPIELLDTFVFNECRPSEVIQAFRYIRSRYRGFDEIGVRRASQIVTQRKVKSQNKVKCNNCHQWRKRFKRGLCRKCHLIDSVKRGKEIVLATSDRKEC